VLEKHRHERTIHMAKFKSGPRLRRLAGFLLALREPQVAKHLRRSGFKETNLREGAQLLAAALQGRLDGAPIKDEKASLRKELKLFAREWLSVVRHALERHYPEVTERLLEGLGWTEGADTANLVTILLQRVGQLDDPTGSYGEDGPRARAVLAERGLTAEVITEIRNKVEGIGAFNGSLDDAEVDPAALRADLRKAEEAAWAWYLEWGGIARAVITDKAALYRLGFGRKPRQASAANDAEPEARTVVVNAAPANALPARAVPSESSVGVIAAPQLVPGDAVPAVAKVGVA
jgi:hypothetical protein